MSTTSLNFHGATEASAVVHHSNRCKWLSLDFRDGEGANLGIAIFTDSPEKLLETISAKAFKAGVAAAAKLLNDKADAYDAEHGSTDPDTGCRDYPGRGAGLEYHSNLIELAEEIADLVKEPT